MDEDVRAVSPASNGQQAGLRPPSPGPPAPVPLQRNGGQSAGIYGSSNSVSNGNALYGSRDSNLMYDSRLSANGSTKYNSHNGYGGYEGYAMPGGGSATPQQQHPRPGSSQGYREAEAVL